ncbi:SPOR domain-containing protein, partial [Vibrio parahaemolyticus]
RISKPIMASENAVVEKDVQPTVVKMTAKPEEKKVVKLTPKEQAKPVKIVPPSKKQAGIQRFGYTIQVAAVGSQAKVDQFANKLPQNGQPIWENYKVVNGTKWFSVLYGDYATSAEAKQAISTLPAQFQQLRPFVKSID